MVAVFFAEGFEECEGLLVVDILRRSGIGVETISVNESKSVTSSHNVTVMADTTVAEADYSKYDMIVLPGGIPGTPNLAANSTVVEQCREFADKKAIAAVCAAPSVLGELGLLKGRKATVYPGFEDKLLGADATGAAVVRDGNVITGNGLGAAIPFALEIVKMFAGEEKAAETAGKIQYKF